VRRVTQYLTREANLATLRRIAALSAPGSQLILTYVDQSELDGDRASRDHRRLQMAFAAAREPWVSGFDPSLLMEDLAGDGFTLLEDLDGLEIKERYCSDRRDLFPMAASHIVHAEVR
jgi:O-methyltransferase involved in polyketide biosynthesis